MKIDAELPFTFCAECTRRQLYDGAILEGSEIVRIDTRCNRAGICKNAIMLYQRRIDDGRPIYAAETEGDE